VCVLCISFVGIVPSGLLPNNVFRSCARSPHLSTALLAPELTQMASGTARHDDRPLKGEHLKTVSICRCAHCLRCLESCFVVCLLHSFHLDFSRHCVWIGGKALLARVDRGSAHILSGGLVARLPRYPIKVDFQPGCEKVILSRLALMCSMAPNHTD
jgi:hypothetical protein